VYRGVVARENQCPIDQGNLETTQIIVARIIVCFRRNNRANRGRGRKWSDSSSTVWGNKSITIWSRVLSLSHTTSNGKLQRNNLLSLSSNYVRTISRGPRAPFLWDLRFKFCQYSVRMGGRKCVCICVTLFVLYCIVCWSVQSRDDSVFEYTASQINGMPVDQTVNKNSSAFRCWMTVKFRLPWKRYWELS
jgi:hypothetical protein